MTSKWLHRVALHLKCGETVITQTATVPPHRLQGTQNVIEQGGRLQLAIDALRNGELRSQREAVKVLNVPGTTLGAEWQR